MMGLCYCWSLVTLRIFCLIAVTIMNFQAALLLTLVGIVASAPISDKLDIMNMSTIGQAHSLINKILEDISTTHAACINSKRLTLGDSTIWQELEYMRKELLKIPSAPVLQTISSISSMETCLAQIVEGLQLHLNLLKDVSKATTLAGRMNGLQADIHHLLSLIKKLQNQAGFDSSKQAQPPVHDLDKHLSDEYKTQVAAHLILQQLQYFSSDVLSSILSIRSMTEMAENSNTVQLSVNLAAV
ncbi:colony stimulating factor 3 (granulocyte) a [Garra rufa]|uniref:colony stimulating factor 3 (granulocyte) a n=1 Tax=Garra rufa TaxID=137080 RepID=UPI003CCE6F48